MEMAEIQSVGPEKLSAKSQNSFTKVCQIWGNNGKTLQACTQRRQLIPANDNPVNKVRGERLIIHGEFLCSVLAFPVTSGWGGGLLLMGGGYVQVWVAAGRELPGKRGRWLSPAPFCAFPIFALWFFPQDNAVSQARTQVSCHHPPFEVKVIHLCPSHPGSKNINPRCHKG